MSRYIIFALAFLLALNLVSAVPDFTVSTPNTILSPESVQRETSFTVTNTGDANLANIIFNHNVQLSDGTNLMTLSFDATSIAALNTGTSQIVRAIAVIPNNMDFGTYSGTVNLTTGSIQKSTNLEIIVSPELCEDGPQGNGINIDIENPDDKDSFKPGEEIELSVNVENTGTSDEKFIVKAYLYNIDSGKKIATAESDEKEVAEDEDLTFDFNLKVPTDTKYLKEDDNYMLFAKAFESGEEDNNCKESYANLELELEDEKAAIESVVFSPATASCGDSITAAVKVRNIGKDSLDDVRVEIVNSDLDINKVSDFFDLSEYAEEDDNDHLAQVIFNIPEDAEEKEYEFSGIQVIYSGESSSTELLESIPSLIVSDCGTSTTSGSTTNDGTTSSAASLALTPTQTSVAVGSSLILNYALTNPTDSDASYELNFVPNGNWAGSVSQTVTVESGQTYTGSLSTMTNNVAQATYTGILYVKSGSNTLTQKQISVDLLNPNQITGGAVFTEKSLLDDLKIGNIPIAFWIIADLILAFVILALVYIVYRR